MLYILHVFQQAELFEGCSRRLQVRAHPHGPAQVVEVLYLVDVEGGRRPSYGESGSGGLCDKIFQNRTGAHRDAVEHVGVAGGGFKPDQVVSAVVDGAEYEVVIFQLAEGFTDGPGFELGRVGGDQDDALLTPLRRAREEPSLPLSPVSLSLRDEVGPSSVADDERGYLRPRVGRGHIPARLERGVLEAGREVPEKSPVEFGGGFVSDGASQAGLRFPGRGALAAM